MTDPVSQAGQASSLVSLARAQRAGAPDEGLALWKLLRSRHLAGLKLRRQRPFGPYVLDLYWIAGQLAVKAAGGPHFTWEGKAADKQRTMYLEQRGLRVLRFTNREILTAPEGVLAAIQALASAAARPNYSIDWAHIVKDGRAGGRRRNGRGRRGCGGDCYIAGEWCGNRRMHRGACR
jgi:very-short-patch-repair endonuclease